MHILVSSAYPLSSPKGNSITAKRIVTLLCNAGHTAEAIHTDMPRKADAMISLHATKTLTSSKRFKALHPNKALIIYLTGTDLYSDQPNNNPDFYEALELADKLVISQEASLQSIPNAFLNKCHYVPASVLLPREDVVPPPPENSFVLASHLRPVKNPFLINKALQKLTNAPVHIFTLGAALDPNMVSEVKNWQLADKRFRWLDNVPYTQTLSWIRQADFTLNTSHSEGGANSIAESIVLGTPVIASKIEGNVGMLGIDYLGLFPPDDSVALAQLITKCTTDSVFKEDIKEQTIALQERFDSAKETNAWLKLLT